MDSWFEGYGQKKKKLEYTRTSQIDSDLLKRCCAAILNYLRACNFLFLYEKT